MVRIVVEGMRGKSEVVSLLDEFLVKLGYNVLAKSTGKEPILSNNGAKRVIKRNNGLLIDRENKKCLEIATGKDFIIFENQAISPYTMRLFNNILQPDIILIPNIRKEHQENLGETIEEIATNFAVHFNIVKTIITTEKKNSVLKIFRKYAKKYGKHLIEVSYDEEIPSLGNMYLVNKTLELLIKKGLTKKEIDEYKEKLIEKYSIKKSKDGIKYFISSKVNDVGSSLITYNYLIKSYPKERFCYVAYFRLDRKDRAKSFIYFFNKVGCKDNVNKIFFRGDFSKYVYSKINPEIKKKIILINKVKIKEVADYCKRNNLVLVTSVNGVNGFMKRLEGKLVA